MMITMMFPKATVSSKKALSTDFMLEEAWLQENSSPAMNMIKYSDP